MKNKARMNILFILILGLLSCSEENGSDNVLPPSNLTLTVTPDDRGNGKVAFTATAENANYYNFYFGEVDIEVPTRSENGQASHTYGQAGTYTVRVQAHTTDAVYVSESAQVSVVMAVPTTPEIPTTGYTTPDNYDGMTLIWRDEFEGSTLNTSDWTFETGNGNGGWGNDELEYYKTDNATISDGYLVIEAKKESFGGFDYTSSRIKTQGKQSFQYGRVDIRAALPHGQGVWPALWMLGENITSVGWPKCGEIDLMELVGGGPGKDNTVHSTLHWDNAGNYATYGQPYTLNSGIFSDEFHVFTTIWDQNKLTSYVDDTKYYEIDLTPAELNEFHEKFFFIFNVAVGGRWPGSPDASTTFPQRMVVDYIRIFQNN